MGSTRRARILLRACLGHLLANSSVQTQGEAWVSMAKCEIAEFSLIVGRRGHDGVLGDQAKEATGQERRGEHADEDSGARCDDDKMMAESLERRKAPKASCGLRRAVECLDRAVEQLKRCHDFAGLRECWCLKVGIVRLFCKVVSLALHLSLGFRWSSQYVCAIRGARTEVGSSKKDMNMNIRVSSLCP